MVSKDGFIGSTLAAYSPRGRSMAGLIRVISMYLILLFRTIHVVVYIIRAAAKGRTTSLIIGCIFGVLGTLLIALCLVSLGTAEGKRRVLGINWGRFHFDAVLGFAVAASLALLIVSFITSGTVGTSGLFTAWCIVWVVIALASWIASKPPTDTYV